jgi:hypothetical protein
MTTRTLLQNPVQGDGENVRAGTHRSGLRYMSVRIDPASLRRVAEPVAEPVEGEPAVETVARELDVIWTSGALVARYDWWDDVYFYEGLEVTPEAVRLQRLIEAGPVLDTHYSGSLSSVLGSVRAASIENGQGRATIRIAETPDLDIIWAKIEQGHIRSLSVGYSIYKSVTTEENGIETRMATDWEPSEISFVPCPADTGCIVVRDMPDGDTPRTRNTPNATNTRSQNMTDITNAGGAGNEQTEVQRAVAAENARCRDLTTYARVAGLSDEVRDAAIESGAQLADFVRANINAHVERVAPTESRSNRTGGEEVNVQAELRARAQAMVTDMTGRAATDAAQPYLGRSLADHAAFIMRQRGEDVTGLPEHEIVRRAIADYSGAGAGRNIRSSGGSVITPGDLPGLLGPALATQFDTGYADDIQDITYLNWSTLTSVPNYNPIRMLHMAGLGGIGPMATGSRFPLARIGENGAFVSVVDQGVRISLDHKAIRNDQYGMFVQFVAELGGLFRLYEENVMIDVLNRNELYGLNGGAVEPVFSDDYENDLGTIPLDDNAIAAAEIALTQQKELVRQPDGTFAATGELVVSYKVDTIMCGTRIARAARRLVSSVLATNTGEVNLNTGLKVWEIPGMADGDFIIGNGRMIKKNYRYIRLTGDTGVNIYPILDPEKLSLQWGALDTFAGACTGRLGMVKGHAA